MVVVDDDGNERKKAKGPTYIVCCIIGLQVTIQLNQK